MVPWHHNIDGSGNGGMGLWSHDIIQYEVITTEQHSTVHRTPANSITDKHYNSYSQCLMTGYSTTVHKSFATSYSVYAVIVLFI